MYKKIFVGVVPFSSILLSADVIDDVALDLKNQGFDVKVSEDKIRVYSHDEYLRRIKEEDENRKFEVNRARNKLNAYKQISGFGNYVSSDNEYNKERVQDRNNLVKRENERILKNWLAESGRIDKNNKLMNANYEVEKEHVELINNNLKSDYNKELDRINHDRVDIKNSIDRQIVDINKRNKEIDIENANRRKEVEAENAKRKKQNADDTLEKEAKQKQKEENDKLLAEYKVKLAEWESKKAKYDKELAEYNVALEAYNTKKKVYEEELREYEKALVERKKLIAANKEADKKVNDENKKKIAEIIKKNKENETEPGHFVSKVKNALVFDDEPDAVATVEINRIGNSGAYGLIKSNRVPHFWKEWFSKLTEDNLNNEYLMKNKISDNIKFSWDDKFTTLRDFDGKNFTTYSVIAKKNRPFTITYTNLKNSTYDGKKIAKVEYTYEVLSSGSSSDFMVVEPAKNPTMSVSIYGDGNNPDYPTRVKITPKFYLEDGTMVTPTEDKPFMFSLLSLNASFRDYADGRVTDRTISNKIKELHSDVMFSESEFGRFGYVHGEFEKKYNVKWNDRNKDGFYSKVRSEWEALEKPLFEKYKELEKEAYTKLEEFYGGREKLPSFYREKVYKINNGEFIKLNGSYVDKHRDGVYSDKNVDAISGWDNQTSKTKYLGAGVAKVTSDNFSLEFGASVPVSQLFSLNTKGINDFISEEVPKYVERVTPEPPVVNGPNEIEMFNKKQPKFNEVKPEPPVFKELNFKPKPPRVMAIDPNDRDYILKPKDVPDIYKLDEPKLGEVPPPNKEISNIPKPKLEGEVEHKELEFNNNTIKPTFELKKTIYEYINTSSASSLNVQRKMLKKLSSFADSFIVRKFK